MFLVLLLAASTLVCLSWLHSVDSHLRRKRSCSSSLSAAARPVDLSSLIAALLSGRPSSALGPPLGLSPSYCCTCGLLCTCHTPLSCLLQWVRQVHGHAVTLKSRSAGDLHGSRESHQLAHITLAEVPG